MVDTLVKESDMVETVEENLQDSELIREIQKYIGEFSTDLVAGPSVRDALLDIMQIALRN